VLAAAAAACSWHPPDVLRARPSPAGLWRCADDEEDDFGFDEPAAGAAGGGAIDLDDDWGLDEEEEA
jgi:hypothetical protein